MSRRRALDVAHIYLMLNKPFGTVCTTVSDSHQTVFDLIDDKYKNNSAAGNLHSVGRLDLDTEGFVLLTTDGKMTHRLTAPESHIAKTYLVHLRDFVDETKRRKYAEAFAHGVHIAPEKKAKAAMTAPAVLEWLEESDITACRLTITEGKFHQVKRMFSAMGNEVVYLKRIAIGSLFLDSALKTGEYRELRADELRFLRSEDGYIAELDSRTFRSEKS